MSWARHVAHTAIEEIIITFWLGSFLECVFLVKPKAGAVSWKILLYRKMKNIPLMSV
jgi:hypothetical protein